MALRMLCFVCVIAVDPNSRHIEYCECNESENHYGGCQYIVQISMLPNVGCDYRMCCRVGIAGKEASNTLCGFVAVQRT